jgi:hypothetical protein
MDKLMDINCVWCALENIDAYLHQQLGCNGVPLASVCRKTVAVLPEADDEEFGMSMYNEDMIRSAHNAGMFFQHDNIKSFGMSIYNEDMICRAHNAGMFFQHDIIIVWQMI